jgi:peptidoglycan hydrolase-like protein with peptidoglycan-binding domain
MSGSDVSALQVRLQRFGLLSGVDGQFGSVTAEAVQAFQNGNGLPATGVADRTTLAALGFDVSAVPG